MVLAIAQVDQVRHLVRKVDYRRPGPDHEATVLQTLTCVAIILNGKRIVWKILIF